MYLALFACGKKEPEFYWQNIEVSRLRVYYVPVEVVNQQKDTSISLTYFSPFDTLTYLLDLKSPEQVKYTSDDFGDGKVFKFVQTHTLTINNKKYVIYQYSTATGAIDFGIEHYWTKEFGFFFTRATYWSMFKISQSSDEEKNKEIWLIIKKLYPEINKGFKFVGVEEGKEYIIQKHHTVIPRDFKR